MTFDERVKLIMEEVSKQPSVTLAEVREQVIWLKVINPYKSKSEKKTEIKHLLGRYHPKWTKQRINKELKRVFINYLRG